MIFEPGQIFARFKIIRKLGEGGMGEVYLAEDQKLGRNVAVKILQASFFDNAEYRARFDREAKTAASISNPNVMAIYDLDSAKDEKSGRQLGYIVMEYVAGESLSEYLQRKKPDMSEKMRIVEKIASGLAAAHKMGVIHRDIKPENIKIDENGEPKILDFGLAKPLGLLVEEGDPDTTDDVSNNLTADGRIMGTVNYMSPEQARGEAVDSRSDIFSFGILLYKLFSDDYPFKGKDRVSILAKILESKHMPLREKDESIPGELDRIIDKCLQKNPGDRYQDTRDLVVDLRSLRRQYDSGLSETLSSISGISKSEKSKSRIMVPSIIAVSIIGLVIVVIFMATGGSGPESPGIVHAHENALAILGFENKTGDEELNWLQSGLPEILLTGLAQNGAVDIISRNRVLDCLEEEVGGINDLPKHQECVNAAKSLGATKILSGSFFKLGDKIRIDARLEDVESGRIILGEKVVGDDPMSLVDSLTNKIAASLNMTKILNERKGVAELTSSSPEAYKYYILGLEKFGQNLYDEAIPLFEKAIEIDSTFALPYLRIGMAYNFQSKIQPSIGYLEKAKKYQNRLGQQDRNILEIYINIFLENKYNEAYVKLQSYLENYPDDKEARSLYAILLYQVSQQPKLALAQLDTVLMLDPRFSMAFDSYIAIRLDQNEYETALEYALKYERLYPNSKTPKMMVSEIYKDLGRLEDAIFKIKEVLEMEPSDINALVLAVNSNLIKNDFEEARRYIEMVRDYHSNDPYMMVRYYSMLANLSAWKGQFNEMIEYHYQRALKAYETGDSSQLALAYLNLSDTYLEFGDLENAMRYSDSIDNYATHFQTLNYPLMLARIDPNEATEAQLAWAEALRNFKANIPPDIWPIGDALGDIFEAYLEFDTTALIVNYEKLSLMPFMEEAGHGYEMARLLVLSGKYNKGIDVLENLVDKKSSYSGGFIRISSNYYLGRAYEGINDLESAKASYEKFLDYWGNADRQLDMIVDAKERLNRLAG